VHLDGPFTAVAREKEMLRLGDELPYATALAQIGHTLRGD